MFKQVAATLALCLCQATISHALAASSTANNTRVVMDDSTGMLWSEFSTLEQGQAEGFRLATDVEFLALTNHAGLQRVNYDFPNEPPFFWSVIPDPNRAEMFIKGDTNLLSMGHGVIEWVPPSILPLPAPSYPYTRQNAALVASTLGNGAPFRLTVISAITSVNQCSWSDATGSGSNDATRCGTSTSTNAMLEAVRQFGKASTLEAPSPSTNFTYRSYLTFSNLSMVNNLAYEQPDTLGYYMVQAIPEASTAGMMSLGLLSMAALFSMRRRQRH